MSRKLTTEEFVTKAKAKHGSRYDYSKSLYAGKAKKVIITCHDHGDFEQIASDHTNGSNCPKCAHASISAKKKIDADIILRRAKEKHGDKYIYHPETYVDTQTKMRITCPQHGDFFQSPAAHSSTGQGCPKCKQGGKYDTDSFIEKMKSQGSEYDYSKTVYTGAGDKITVTCLKHGDFHPIAFQHGYGVGCPACGSMGQSSQEKEIVDIIGEEVDVSNRTIIAPRELDIVVHRAKLAIEFNGTFWHSLSKRPKGYHRDKRIAANREGYRLISISEQDWKDKRELLIRIINNALGKSNTKKVNARQCDLTELTAQEARLFLEDNHVQGYARATHKFGLRDISGEIVAVMTFNRIENNTFDMCRYATSCTVRGGQSKLFKHAVRVLGMEECQSFVDCDYFDGRSYENSGFKLVEDTVTSFRIWHRKVGFMPRQKWWKVNIPDTLRLIGMDEEIFSPEKTQVQMMNEAGCLIVENSGTKKYMWKKGA